MWIVCAAGSAFFAGVTSILAKCGIKKTDSDIATAIRTIVVLIVSWFMVFVAGSQKGIDGISPRSLLFLILSGLATGASWLCYFKALQMGDINKVVPIDKSSTVLTIILAFILFKEPIGITKALGILGIAAGTYLMIERKENKPAQAVQSTEKSPVGTAGGKNNSWIRNSWIIYAVLSAVFASLTSILGKFGIEGVESNLGTAIRTIVVLVMSWVVVFAKGKKAEIANVRKKELGFIVLSGFATGASWLCYYKALQEGPASIVVPIDKLSILITIAFSYFVFKEKLSKKAMAGLVLIVAGTLVMLIK